MVGSQVVWKQELELPQVLWLSCFSVLIPAPVSTPLTLPFPFPLSLADLCTLLCDLCQIQTPKEFPLQTATSRSNDGLSSQLQILKGGNVIAVYFFLKV